jgi:hypothetical protein
VRTKDHRPAFAVQRNLTTNFGTLEREKVMKTNAKRLGMTTLIILGTLLALVTSSAASAVWGS